MRIYPYKCPQHIAYIHPYELCMRINFADDIVQYVHIAHGVYRDCNVVREQALLKNEFFSPTFTGQRKVIVHKLFVYESVVIIDGQLLPFGQ